jgi:hypothetical protein
MLTLDDPVLPMKPGIFLDGPVVARFRGSLLHQENRSAEGFLIKFS